MKQKIKDILHISALICLALVVLYIIIGCFCTSSNKIIKQDSNYLYVKEYTLYNRDSSIVRYKADKIYNGVIVDKDRRSSYHGVPGKGGHHSTSYYVTVQFNGTTQTFKSGNLYRKYNKGDKVRVKEVWYPGHNITVL